MVAGLSCKQETNWASFTSTHNQILDAQTPRMMSTIVEAAKRRKREPPTYCTACSDRYLPSTEPPSTARAVAAPWPVTAPSTTPAHAETLNSATIVHIAAGCLMMCAQRIEQGSCRYLGEACQVMFNPKDQLYSICRMRVSQPGL